MRARRRSWRFGRRRSLAHWSVVAGIALATSLTAAALVGEAERRVESWGPGRAVPVATRDLEPGTVLTEGDLRWEARPAALVPAGTADPGAALTGRAVVARILEGEPFVLARLAPDGVRGLGALLPPATAAVVIPATTRSPRLHAGDTVDAFTGPGQGWAPDAAGGSRPATRSSSSAGSDHNLVARRATVIETADDGAVTIAVRRDEVAGVAAAILDGSVVLALNRPG